MDGSYEYAVWAPTPRRVRLRTWPAERGEAGRRDHDRLDTDRLCTDQLHTDQLHTDHDMVRQPCGWWRLDLPGAGPGTDYAFLLDDDPSPLPDPRSPWQPAGVHGPSRRYDHDAYRWNDTGWTGRALPGSVIYELHVGTFTMAGTFDAAIERLDHLVDLGVDLVELLPVASFNGQHNWGYDGVCWYAPHEEYGGPDGLKRFVDACHGRGIGVLLDVVYNHFGPSGAYPPRFAGYLNQSSNPWGRTLNLDGPGCDEVRRYILDNIRMWLRDYHLDGLRLDAVHALVDTQAVHLLEQAAAEVDALAAHLRRPLSLIAESDLNDPRLVTARDAGGYGLSAVWDDDVHHALHALLTGERQGYYADFGSAECLATVLTSAFFHAGTFSSFRGRTHGRPVDRRGVPGHRFVVCLQNHDQIGNRAAGDRITASIDAGLAAIGATLLLTCPFTPMLFMGQEWAAGTPWQFFTSHGEPELARAVVEGRRAEFAAHGWNEREVPDPQDPRTFLDSKLDWSELERPASTAALEVYRALIALRRRVADLSDPRLDQVEVDHGDQWLTVLRRDCVVAVNLAGTPNAVPLPQRPAAVRRLAGSVPRQAPTVLFAVVDGTLVDDAAHPGITVRGEAVELPGRCAAVLGFARPGAVGGPLSCADA